MAIFRFLLLAIFFFYGVGCGPGSYQRTPILKGKLVFKFILAFGTAGSGPGEFLDPQGLCLGPLGNIYVADTGNDRIQIFDSQGKFMAQFGSFGQEQRRFNQPTDVAVCPSLHLYVVDSHNRRLQIFNAYLEPLAEITDDFGWLAGITVSNYGDAYLTDAENNRLIKINPFGKVVINFTGVGRGDLFHPKGLALNREEHIYVCDSGNDRIAVFDQFGTLLFCFGEGTLSGPEGISINSQGEVFVADTGNNRIVVFSEKGNFLQRFGEKGTDKGFFQMPRDVATDGDFLYVLDSGNSRVQKFKVVRTVGQ